jgi:hypothetical protein
VNSSIVVPISDQEPIPLQGNRDAEQVTERIVLCFDRVLQAPATRTPAIEEAGTRESCGLAAR